MDFLVRRASLNVDRCGVAAAPVSSCEAAWAGLLDMRASTLAASIDVRGDAREEGAEGVESAAGLGPGWHAELAAALGLGVGVADPRLGRLPKVLPPMTPEGTTPHDSRRYYPPSRLASPAVVVRPC